MRGINHVRVFCRELTRCLDVRYVLVALAAAVALLRKKTKLLKSDGTAEDDFATDLLGKPVAISAIRANSAQLAIDDDGEIIVTMNTED